MLNIIYREWNREGKMQKCKKAKKQKQKIFLLRYRKIENTAF